MLLLFVAMLYSHSLRELGKEAKLIVGIFYICDKFLVVCITYYYVRV